MPGVLVLVVDRDGDVERKAGIKTPLVGREEVLRGAMELLLADPEEADGNTMFKAVKVYDELPDREKEIAVLSGLETRGPSADRKVLAELEEVLEKFPASEAIFVSDGYEDETLIPIISSKVPVTSVVRVVVKHSARVEETYAIIARYLKMIWHERPYRTYFLGIPGIATLLFGAFSFFGLLQRALEALAIVLGGALVVRGFGLDEKIQVLAHFHPTTILRTVSLIASISALILGLYLSYLDIASLSVFQASISNPEIFAENAALIAGTFIKSFTPALVASVMIYVFGSALQIVLSEGEGLSWRILVAVASVILYFILEETANVLIEPLRGIGDLVVYVVVGLSVMFLSGVLLRWASAKLGGVK